MRNLSLITLLAGTLGVASAQSTVTGPGTTTANVTINAKVGPACELQTVTDKVTLSPTLYWTNTTDATGSFDVNVKCNVGTPFNLKVPATVALNNGLASINATLTGTVLNVIASTEGDNGAASSDGQLYPIDITVAHGAVTQSQPTGLYQGTATVTLEILAPIAPPLP
ncbi:hypothetical protein [Deinococcus pimensis]|uniref:hypothetical protein n=1 Tax=Deinococcus pimensis TaxID=309888 RepID=UPI000486C659|nr:hypothetical protein [Deinococcus pimensis]